MTGDPVYDAVMIAWCLLVGGIAAFLLTLCPFWPWDWKGVRKEIKLKSRKNDWD